MSNPALARIALVGFVFFLEEGTTVDGVTISSDPTTGKPDNNPTTNWTNGSIGDVMKFKFDNKTVSDPYMQGQTDGTWLEVQRERVVSEFLDLTTRQMGELVYRLQHGFASKIVNGTAQTPGAVDDRKIRGWLRMQGRQEGGTDLIIMDWWAEMRLNKQAEFDGPKVYEPALRFFKLPSTGNTAVF